MQKRKSKPDAKPDAKSGVRGQPLADARGAGQSHGGRGTNLWIYAALLGGVFAVYGQTAHFEFVTYDDPDYVTANPHVQAGFTMAGVRWALGSSFAGNWFPLTWLSHMLDCQLFGVDAGWHHLTNVIIHAISTLLLFYVLQRITGARWRSAVVAWLFALHPLHVESVAWIAERKDVLSGLLFVATMWAYARYAARTGALRYAFTLLLFALGLMAKPMLVTLPIVLGLLDLWPLRRGLRIVEKLPFLAIAIAVSVVTYLVHASAGAAVSLDLIPLPMRIENALVSYAAYLVQMLWPVGLAVFYPFPVGSLVMPAILAVLELAAFTLLAIREFPRRPYLAVGWLWYLVTLVPVIGLIQVGSQARADRYTYIPMIGIGIAVVWGVSEAFAARPRVATAVATVVCAACVVLTWAQLQYWRDSVALYQRAIDVTEGNYLAQFNLGTVLEGRGDLPGAVAHLREAVKVRPRFAVAHSELGQILAKLEKPEEAAGELQIAVSLKSNDPDTWFRLGAVLGSLGRIDDASRAFAQGFRYQPDNAEAHYNFGLALAQAGRTRDAAREFRAVVASRPTDFEARFNLGIALGMLGEGDEAVTQLVEAVRLNPSSNEARQALEDARQLKSRR